VIHTSPLRKLELLTRPLQAGSLSTAFRTSLALASFLSEVKRTFTNFPKTHHMLMSSRVMPSRLGGFTSDGNKCHKDCFTNIKCSSAHKEDSLNPPLMISHKSQDPHKEELGRAHKGLGWVYFMGGTSNLQRRKEESFYTCPPKTSHLETSRWSSSAQTGPPPPGLENRTIQFSLVQWDVECMWPLCFTHLNWVFRLLLSMRLCWQSM
jgi:hypothetical protein